MALSGRRGNWDRNAIVRAFDAWHERHLRAPAAHEWWRAGDGHPSSWTVRRAFGSWNAGVDAAGLKTRARGEPRQRTPRRRSASTGRFVSVPGRD